MKLYLVRHGETEWNRMEKIQGQVEIPLNANGIAIAYKTADMLAHVPFDAAFSSPLSRASETGRIILGDRDVELIKREELIEIGFGIWEGYSILMATNNPKDVVHNFFEKPEAYLPPETAESYEQLFKRSNDFMSNVIIPLEDKKENILITTHSAWIRSVVNPLLGIGLEDFWKLEMPNCAVSIIEVQNGKMSVVVAGISATEK